MFAWCANVVRGERGNAVIEFALVLPLLLLLFSGLVEVGRAHFQAMAVEKGVRAGTLFAARRPFPLDPADQAKAINLIRTGTLDGSGAVLVSGWTRPDAGVSFTSRSFAVDDATVPVIRVVATVPFDALVPGLWGFLGMNDFTISAFHEQAHVGD